MKQIDIPVYTKFLFSKEPVKVLDSGHMLHFYFESEYGLTSCSYSKDALINLLYKSLISF